MRTMLFRLLDALSFFTRFVSSKARNQAEWEACVAFFFPAGCCLGVFLLLGPFVCQVFRDPPWFFPLCAGWMWLALEIWASRALHWDGLADLADALGSGKSGDMFWTILHDSRLGAFGAIALFLVGMGQWLCASVHCAHGTWLVLVFAPAWARLSPLWLSFGVGSNKSSKLGCFVVAALKKQPLRKRVAFCEFFILPLLLAIARGSAVPLLLVPAEACLLLRLRSYAVREGGVSGDFFGAAIELSQLLVLFLTLF